MLFLLPGSEIPLSASLALTSRKRFNLVLAFLIIGNIDSFILIRVIMSWSVSLCDNKVNEFLTEVIKIQGSEKFLKSNPCRVSPFTCSTHDLGY